MFSFLILCIFFVRGCFSKEIFISQSADSKDVDDCGNFTSPCRTIDFTLSKLANGFCEEWILLIDGGSNITSPYVYLIKKMIKINCSIVLRIWEENRRNLPKPILKKQNQDSSLLIFGNISLFSIDFHSSSPGWITTNHLCSKLYIINCVFEWETGDSESTDILGLEWTCLRDLQVLNSKLQLNIEYFFNGFTSLKFYPKITWCFAKMYKDNIVIYNSKLIDITFYFEIDFNTVYFSNCTIENSYITVELYTIIASNVTFKSSKINMKANSIFVTGCVFDNATVHITEFTFIIGGVECIIYIAHSVFMNSNLENDWNPALRINTNGAKTSFVSVIQCSFYNNTSPRRHASSLSATGAITSLRIYGCKFQAFKNNEIIVNISKSTVRDFNITITCKDGDFISNSNYTEITGNIFFYSACQNCEKSTYRLTKTTNVNKMHEYNQRCIDCPYNSICEKGQIRLKGGYWGYKDTRTSLLTLVPCTKYFCCRSKEQCTSYNKCTVNRRGRLCSECQPGFSCEISKKYKCIPNSECNKGAALLVVYIVTAIIFILTLIFFKEIIFIMKTVIKICWEKHRADNSGTIENTNIEEIELLDFANESLDRDQQQLLLGQVLFSAKTRNQPKHASSTFVISGSIKITFFFYQAASLIRIQSADKTDMKFPKVLDFIYTMFNIKLDLSYSKHTLCILPDLNVIHVKTLKLGFIFITLLLIFVFWCAASLRALLKSKRNGLSENLQKTLIDDDVPSYCNPPFIVRVKCAYLQFLLTAYASIAVFAFEAVHCVDINGEFYLYTQASIQCFQPWQYGMVAFITMCIVPFPLCLYVASKLLHKCCISPNQFLLVMSFPPTLFCFLIKQKFSFQIKQAVSIEDAILSNHLMLVVNEPFRELVGGDGSKLCWESMLILQRMLLAICYTFLISPILKLLPMGALLLLFVFQHQKMKPFSDNILNDAEFGSLLILLSLVFVNMFWAFTKEHDLMKLPLYKQSGEVLMYYEVFICVLPFIGLVFYIGYKLFKKLVTYCNRCKIRTE